jgi:nucleoside-diphosphate-sugar epimerase
VRFDKVLITGAAGLLGRAVVRELSGRCELAGLDLRAGEAPLAWHEGDVTDAAVVHRALAGCDAVVHIAAIPNIWSGSGERIMQVNVMGTWQVLAAAEALGVRRVVLCSSDSVAGFTVREGRMLPPLYLPIDQAHPLRPTDPYGLSKLLGEETGRSFANRGLEVVVLRPVFVAYPEMAGEIAARARDPEGYRGPAAGGPSAAGGGPCWHHVDPRDAARGFRLALELEEVRFAAFFVSAAVTLAPEPTLARLARVLGSLPEVRRPEIWHDNPFAPLYDLGPTREVLGLVPEHHARHLIPA